MNFGKESETIEFKESTGELHQAIESIASIVNKHSYGELYFGVKDNGDIKGQIITDSRYYARILPYLYGRGIAFIAYTNLLLDITYPVVVMINPCNFGYLYMRVFTTFSMKILTILSSDEY